MYKGQPQADQVVCGDFTRIRDYLTVEPEDYVVIMTNGHEYDFQSQVQVLQHKTAYVGVIGSRKKTAFVNQRLRDAGISDEAIAFVHTPIGTAIKAVTPEAVSYTHLDVYKRQIGDAAAAELAAQHRDDPVSVSLEEAEFPLKAYDGCALPSGGYLALRVVIGAGEGRNWWCVVYPPLCTAAASDLSRTALGAGLTEDDLSLITGDGDGYVLRFRSLELWERLRQWLGK